MPVYEDERGTYLFSAYDLCMLEHLPDLLTSGVCSLKIEGRMKTAYYVASVVSAYRRALNLLDAKGQAAYEKALPSLLAEINKASHRVSNTGFFYGKPQPAAGAAGFTQDMEFVGEVSRGAFAGEPAEIVLKNRFYVGDTLEVLTPEGSKPFTVRYMRLCDTGEDVQTASVAGTRLMTAFPFDVGTGDLLRGPNRNHQSK